MMYNFRRDLAVGRHLIVVETYQKNPAPVVSVSWQKN